MKRALLVNPWITDFKCHDFWIKPLGLLKISALLKKNGIEIDFIDCMDRLDPSMPENIQKSDENGKGKFNFEILPGKSEAYAKIPRNYKRYGIAPAEFEARLETLKNPDIIIVTSGMTYTYEGTHLAIHYLKEKFQLSRVLLGGIYPTLSFKHAQDKSGTDFIWKGDITKDFVLMLERILGMEFKNKTQKDLNGLTPDYSLYKKLESVAVKFTSGCPFSCSYCGIKQFTEKYFQREQNDVLKELDYYRERGIKNIAFYDDALFYKNFYIKNVLKEIIDRKYNFRFHTPNGLHAQYIDKELAGLLKPAGFIDLRISLESADYNIQKQTGGKVDNESYKKAVSCLLNAGFAPKDIGTYILAGMPGQHAEMVESDIDFVSKQGVKVKLANYSPIPGTLDFMKLNSSLKAALTIEPLKQNEFYFLTINPDYSWRENERIKALVNQYNNTL